MLVMKFAKSHAKVSSGLCHWWVEMSPRICKRKREGKENRKIEEGKGEKEYKIEDANDRR